MDQSKKMLEETIVELRQENASLKNINDILVTQVIEKTPCHLFWKDADGVYLGCNLLMAEKAGFKDSKEVLSKTDLDMSWSEQYEVLRRNDLYVMSTGKTLEFEETGLMSDGQVQTHLSTKTPLYNRDQEVIGVLGISVDVTDSKEKERLKDVTDTKEKERLKMEMASKLILVETLKTISASLAHEVRTPLTGLKLGLSSLKIFLGKGKAVCERLEQKGGVSESFALGTTDFTRQIAYVEKMLSHIDMSSNLMDIQLKNMMTEEIDKSRFVQCDMQTCVSESLEAFTFPIDVSRDCVKVVIDQSFRFLGDTVLFRHVLWNLLNNALHFIREEGKGEIFIEGIRQGDKYQLSFKDTAKGMPSEDAQKVFSRYYSKRTNGSGLGLNFCRLVMEAFGGKISCQAEEGQYAEFVLSFPQPSH